MNGWTNIVRRRYTGSWAPEKTFETYKGVGWTNLPYTSQARAAFQKANPNPGAQVGWSLNGPVDGDGGSRLLGGAVPVAHADAAPSGTPAFLVGLLVLLGVPVVLVAGGVTPGITLTRRRRRPAGPNGVR